MAKFFLPQDTSNLKTTFTMAPIGIREIPADHVEIKKGLAYFKTESTVGTSQPLVCPECKGKGFIELLNSKVNCNCRGPSPIGAQLETIRQFEAAELEFDKMLEHLGLTPEKISASCGLPANLLMTSPSSSSELSYSQARQDQMNVIRELKDEIAREYDGCGRPPELETPEQLQRMADRVLAARASVKDFTVKMLANSLSPMAVLRFAEILIHIDRRLATVDRH